MARSARTTEAAERSCASDTLEQAFVCYQSELLGMLYHLVGNLEDARDTLQETFVKCWRHRDQVAGVQHLKAWIFRIALNAGRDARQTAWRRHRKDLPDDEAVIAPSPHGPEEQVEHNEQITRIRLAVRQLRTEEQEVFLLRQNGELTYEEIADTLGIPSGTVKTRMRMAVTRLREVLAEAL